MILRSFIHELSKSTRSNLDISNVYYKKITFGTFPNISNLDHISNLDDHIRYHP